MRRYRRRKKNDHDLDYSLSQLIESYQTVIEQYLISQHSELTPTYFNNMHSPIETSYLARFGRYIKKFFKWSTKVSIYAFSCIGLLFTAVYVGMQFGVFNVQGSITQRDSFYGNLTKIAPTASVTPVIPSTTSSITAPTLNCSQQNSNCAWVSSPEWGTVDAGLIKDSGIINEVASQTGVSARMIIASVAPEQLRLFTSEREIYEKYFQPLKVLGSMTDFSLGIAGVKQQTANQIEANLSDVNSPFYPGPGYSELITYPAGASHATALYDRLTSNNHYYDYLYVGLFIKELESQWLKAGYNIDQRPDVITTLYNIGIDKSVPKSDPEAGGATIMVNNQSYSFGELGTLIYNSDQLTSVFPAQTN